MPVDIRKELNQNEKTHKEKRHQALLIPKYTIYNHFWVNNTTIYPKGVMPQCQTIHWL